MFRKIHSKINRGSNDEGERATVFSELRRELGVYADSVIAFVVSLLRQYPRSAFGLMILLMLGSMILSFTLFRRLEAKKPAANAGAISAPLNHGFGQILQKGAELQRLIDLKSEIELMLSKDSLSSADSVQLSAALDSLHALSIRSPQ